MTDLTIEKSKCANLLPVLLRVLEYTGEQQRHVGSLIGRCEEVAEEELEER